MRTMILLPKRLYSVGKHLLYVGFCALPFAGNECDKLEVIALLLLYLSQNTFYYKCCCYKGSYKGIVV